MQAKPPTGFRLPISTQNVETRTEVDVKDGCIEHKRRHGFDASGLCFRESRLGLAQVNDLQIITQRIKGVGDMLLGGDTDRATGVEEYCFGFHSRIVFC